MLTCIYCGKTSGEVARFRRRAGYRVPCNVRDTPKGFHKYRFTLDIQPPDKDKEERK